MTNEELLARIDEDEKFLEQYFGAKFKGQSALRAVVEMHSKSGYHHANVCDVCDAIHPCPTIQAIEKELK